MEMVKHDWYPKTFVLWGAEWAKADLTGTERLMFIFLRTYVTYQDWELVFEMPDFRERFEQYSDIFVTTQTILQSLADKGFIQWKTFRHLGQEWHSVTIAQKGRDLCAG